MAASRGYTPRASSPWNVGIGVAKGAGVNCRSGPVGARSDLTGEQRPGAGQVDHPVRDNTVRRPIHSETWQISPTSSETPGGPGRRLKEPVAID